MQSEEIRKRFLEFFKKRGHAIIPSASLVPENDSSTLFTTAGMQPLVPYLLGEKHPKGEMVASVQKCVRTGDIDEVGDATHLTFFEMLGNWSFGGAPEGYFKEETIKWSYEFLTNGDEVPEGDKGLGLLPERLYITVFEGNDDAPRDEESAKFWQKVGIREERIYFMGAEKNWWSAGDNGPCGPDTEMYYDITEEGLNIKSKEDFLKADKEQKLVEIWNDVFMEYYKSKQVFLIDGMGCLYDENFNLNQDLFDSIKNLNTQKILVVNGFKERAEKLLEGTSFEVFSLDNKIKKDDPEFFKKCLEKYNLEPGQIFYIDHSKDNVNSAKTLGIKSEVFEDTPQAKEVLKNNLFKYTELSQKNVDTGAGLERMATVLQKKESVYDTDLFSPVLDKIKALSGNYKEREARIIADHIRASIFMIADGVLPSNTDRGYVLRRILRTAIRLVDVIGIKSGGIAEIIKIIQEKYRGVYKEVTAGSIINIIIEEELKFRKTLVQGLKEFEKGTDPFVLFTTYGFPIEMTKELAQEKGIKIDEEKFYEDLKKHQELSRTSSGGMFKGGLADSSPKTTMLHTATHLMLAGLRKYLGNYIHQHGSNITTERTRFDFNYPEKVGPEILKKVEDYVNEAIAKKADVVIEQMSKDEARETGVEGSFWEKYPDIVNVYMVKDSSGTIYSKELCGGPHVKNTGDIEGKFKIVKEESSSAGIRRIKAVLEDII